MLIENDPVTGLEAASAGPQVEIVIPVFNEERGLDRCVSRLVEHLSGGLPFSWTVTIADNASDDGTWREACRLVAEQPGVRAIHLDQKGRGRALKAAWSASRAEVLAYMDVDLSTDLAALLPLLAPLLSGHSDLAVGSRLAAGSRVQRGAKRELISRSYNALLHSFLGVRFSDAQCGFKAIRRDVANVLLPLVLDDEWFFDTELLVLAERNGLRVAEVPVDWVDDPDSRVAVTSTAFDDLRGVWRLARSFSAGGGTIAPGSLIAARPDPGLATQVVPFAAVGLVTTLVFAVTFLVLADPLGFLLADVIALSLATVLNLAANRRLTFAHRGPSGMVRHYVAGLLVAAIPLSFNLLALGLAMLVSPGSIWVALGALTIANLAATTLRFGLLRRWVFSSS